MPQGPPFHLHDVLARRPCSSEWPLAQQGGLVQPEHSLSLIVLETLIVVLHIHVGDAMLFTSWTAPGPADQGHSWRPAMRLMEYERASWLYCFLTTLQGTETYSPYTAGQEELHHLSSRNAWEG